MIPLDIEAAQKGSLRQLADDLFWARFDLPFRLNHINLYILATAEGWVLIDTGLNNEITAQHWQALLKGPLAGKPVYQIIVCLLYTSPSPRDCDRSRMPSSA